MSVLVAFALMVAFGVIPLLLLYFVTEGEISDPTIVDRSEAERIAQERGGRPVDEREDADDSTDWGNDGEWGSDSGNQRR